MSLDKVRELQPNSVQPLMQAARIHALQDNFAAALHVLKNALAIKPDHLEVLLMRAEIHGQSEDFAKALADVEKVLKLKPGLLPAARFHAMLLARADRLDEAVAELEQLCRHDPKDLASRLQLAMCYVAGKRYQQAVEVYSAVLAEQPDHGIAQRGRGDALLNVGRHEAAVADYEEALKARPEDTGILNNLAWVLATSPQEKLRDGKRAIVLATKACELTEYKQAHILSTLAAGYAETGEFENAVKWAEKGVEIGREDQKEPLGKELESYRAGKPWRELLSDGEP